MKKLVVLLLVGLLIISGCSSEEKGDDTCTDNNDDSNSILNLKDLLDFDGEKCDSPDKTLDKPVIYLYPETSQEIKVKLDFNGDLICTYPEYKDGWNVTASPDGTLYSQDTNKKYTSLFWEGTTDVEFDLSKGYVVSGKDTMKFLETKLSELGLNYKEANEFIVYWLPRMQNNDYNLITFQKEIYTEVAKLEITPNPDSLLRVFMAYKAIDEPIEIEEPQLDVFERTGFTVVEWGGTEIK